MPYSIHSCSSEHFNAIKSHIQKFELDNRCLEQHEFLVALQHHMILGFGRIREHIDCSELCSLGVIEPERNKGVGTALTKALIKKAEQQLYLVCIIPEFFEPLGFKVCENYPDSLKAKLNYCTNELVVPETYVVMKMA